MDLNFPSTSAGRQKRFSAIEALKLFESIALESHSDELYLSDNSGSNSDEFVPTCELSAVSGSRVSSLDESDTELDNMPLLPTVSATKKRKLFSGNRSSADSSARSSDEWERVAHGEHVAASKTLNSFRYLVVHDS
jgi:hypothetical protein